MVKNNLFIHIPRTGGTSIHGCLDKYASAIPDHILGKDARREWPDSFIYTFMRNPYTRMVSLYECQFPDHQLADEAKEKFNRWSNQPLTFEYYVEIVTEMEYDYGHDERQFQHWRSQTDWIFDDDDCLIVDYIGCTETIDKDVNEISSLIGVEEEIIGINHVNSSNWRYEDYKEYFNDDTRKKVKKYYERDLDFLKIKF